MMARRKKTVKKPRIEEEKKVAGEEEAPEPSEKKEQLSIEDVKMYMVVMDKVPEPISAEPVGVKPPKVIHWDVLELYTDKLKAPGISITKLVMEYLCMMFKSDEVKEIIRNVFQAVTSWTLYETSGVYSVTLDRNHIEYFLVDKVYNHSRLKLHSMLKKKLGCVENSEMAKYLIQRTINQSLGLDANTGI
ncbi:hypothetical protein L6452_37532 [Arctium lappa]|uniref:Uncharacterized protein n=1 Tax=Arctium lappa TaxID=4217 RepID=A0ACB8Y3Z3_ARCLA|nr:hypothetical protein L6452_37532 [Arctium lappa]